MQPEPSTFALRRSVWTREVRQLLAAAAFTPDTAPNANDCCGLDCSTGTRCDTWLEKVFRRCVGKERRRYENAQQKKLFMFTSPTVAVSRAIEEIDAEASGSDTTTTPFISADLTHTLGRLDQLIKMHLGVGRYDGWGQAKELVDLLRKGIETQCIEIERVEVVEELLVQKSLELSQREDIINIREQGIKRGRDQTIHIQSSYFKAGADLEHREKRVVRREASVERRERELHDNKVKLDEEIARFESRQQEKEEAYREREAGISEMEVDIEHQKQAINARWKRFASETGMGGPVQLQWAGPSPSGSPSVNSNSAQLSKQDSRPEVLPPVVTVLPPKSLKKDK
ncbi:hypothetical protein VNI00_011103 [Paramarasmius palmivorus]|uniref:Uncharacterized protein n=1 Tax=Paramarasmius palmivorus TaxID=297713 RepID=A0AAW0CE95_9AGAR